MVKVLFLNPPGDKIYIRDYYCSKVSKASYYYHPLDLLMLSGWFVKEHDILVLDCMVEGWSEDESLEKILAFSPDYIFFLTGVVSFNYDMKFIDKVKRLLPQTITIGSGDILLSYSDYWLENFNQLDAILFDFTTDDALKFVENRKDIKNLYYRKNGKIIKTPVIRANGGTYSIPRPLHELFPNHKYHYPFVLSHPFATLLTDYGCPYKCAFCTIGTLGFKVRPVDEVLEELFFIKNLGLKDVYFDDQTFGVNKKRTFNLLTEMYKNKLNIGWIAFSRVNILDYQTLYLMKLAGCHTVVFGIESANEDVLNTIEKGISIEKIKNTIRICNDLNIRTVGTFIIGLPGEDYNKVMQTIKLATSLGLDFASFNVPVPRPGTYLEKYAVEKKWIPKFLTKMDQSGTFATMGNEYLSAEEIYNLRNLASKKFYFRPHYLINRLLKIKSFYEFRCLFKEGLFMWQNFEKRH